MVAEAGFVYPLDIERSGSALLRQMTMAPILLVTAENDRYVAAGADSGDYHPVRRSICAKRRPASIAETRHSARITAWWREPTEPAHYRWAAYPDENDRGTAEPR